MQLRLNFVSRFVVALLIAACGSAGVNVAPSRAAAPPHILVLLMENHSYPEVVGNPSMPFLNGLVASNGSVSTTDLSHPSLPNYLGLIGGSIDNNPADTTPQDGTYPGPQLTDELAAAGIGWKAYMQDMPAPCDLTDQFRPGGYDVNHDPFMYFNTVRTNSAQCNRVVPYPQLTADLNAGGAPPFLWVSPNTTNDMHDGTYQQGDAFLRGLVTQVEASSWWSSSARIIVTFDEGETTEQVLTVVVGSAHGTAASGGNHYGTLRGLEEAYGVGLLGHSADGNVGDLLPLLTGASAPPSAPPSTLASPPPHSQPSSSPSPPAQSATPTPPSPSSIPSGSSTDQPPIGPRPLTRAAPTRFAFVAVAVVVRDGGPPLLLAGAGVLACVLLLLLGFGPDLRRILRRR
jgi:phosphatidylinositol-3-phosphatase